MKSAVITRNACLKSLNATCLFTVFWNTPVLTEYVGQECQGVAALICNSRSGVFVRETRDATIWMRLAVISNPFVETQCFLISDNDSTTIMQVIDRLVIADAVMFIGMEAKSMIFVPNTTMQGA